MILGLQKECVSQRHFVITFDERKRLILKDVSRWGSYVSYNQHDFIKRRNFTWILPPGCDVTIRTASRVLFSIEVPHRSDIYDANVTRYLKDAHDALPSIKNLGVITAAVPTVAPTPNPATRQRVYVPVRIIGSGQFGEVHMVYNASTWDVMYAGKILFGDESIEKEVETLQRLSHVCKYLLIFCVYTKNHVLETHCKIYRQIYDFIGTYDDDYGLLSTAQP